jgi:hypothetical protein
VAATGVPGTMAYAGIAQVAEDGQGMQAYSGWRIPLVYWESQRRGLPQAWAFKPSHTDTRQHRQLDVLNLLA